MKTVIVAMNRSPKISIAIDTFSCLPRTWHSHDTKVGGAMAMATDVPRLSDEQELALRRLGAFWNVLLDPRDGTHAFDAKTDAWSDATCV